MGLRFTAVVVFSSCTLTATVSHVVCATGSKIELTEQNIVLRNVLGYSLTRLWPNAVMLLTG